MFKNLIKIGTLWAVKFFFVKYGMSFIALKSQEFYADFKKADLP
jgi:hypothetical protein